VVKAKLLSLAILVCGLAGCFGWQRPDLKVAHMVQPNYPVPARLKDIQGAVKLGIIIEIDGKVSSAFGSGADPILIKSAEENARQWIWGPFRRDSSFLTITKSFINTSFKENRRP
jgi:hypothetical protein